MRIGILGGVFDPIHLGHLFLAEQAREQLALAKVIFIPSFISPHKKEVVSPYKRYKMLYLAISKNPFFEISLLEIKRKGVSYSIDTIEEIRKKYKEDEFFFILGSDSWYQFSSWKDNNKLLKLVRIAVMERRGFPIKKNRTISNIQGEVLPISSSQIRERTKQNKSICYLVPENVRRYILKKGLYK